MILSTALHLIIGRAAATCRPALLCVCLGLAGAAVAQTPAQPPAQPAAVSAYDDDDPAPHTATDTLTLREVTAVGHGPTAPRVEAASGSIRLSSAMLDKGVRVLGEADMLKLIELMPGINTISDYSAGATIDGADYSQNLYRLSGVPVLFPYHFGGIFSTFNSTLYPNLKLNKSIHTASSPAVLGGTVDATPPVAAPADFTGEVNAGLTASTAAVRLPLADGRLTIGAGGRLSYINTLYGDLLNSSATDINYDFADADLTASWRPDQRTRIEALVHYNRDHLDYEDKHYGMRTLLRWSNLAAGASYSYRGSSLTQTHRLSYSSLVNRLQLAMTNLDVQVPASAAEATLQGTFGWSTAAGSWTWDAGYEASLMAFRPQSARVEGIGSDVVDNRAPRSLTGLYRLHAEASRALSPRISLTLGLVGALCQGPDSWTTGDLDPRLTAVYDHGPLTVTLHAGRYSQYYHYVGLSDIGMASNFRLPPSRQLPPQHALNLAAAATRRFGPASQWSASVDAYIKLVRNQAEYVGSVLDLIDNDYTPELFTRSSRGYNTGINLMLSHIAAPLTGWLSYGYNVGRRHWVGEDEWFTAASDIRHALTASLAWTPRPQWTFSAIFNLASGRPYTPVSDIYIIGERLIMQYGERNSARFPLYHRLDLSATWKKTIGRFTHLVNLSVLNAYAHENVEVQSYVINTATGYYRLRRVGSLFRFLPSLSYTLRF